ncbi:MAG: PQQ-binding-like beta-propeller repeat protein [Bryobacteraceae bacterium]|nr:PQQ-binding-like beta-propeller repeat protein [Bryobacteraceae bacterium]
MRRISLATVSVGCVLLAVGVAFAQRGVDWVVGSNDAHRSAWVRMDAKINAESMRKPGFELLWKMKMNGAARQMSSLTPPSLLDFYISYRGFRSLAFIGNASGSVTGVDIDLARVEWEKTFPTTGPSTVACPGGITSGVVRVVNSLAYPSPLSGSGIGRGTPAKSGVGLPDEGAVTLKTPPMQRPGPPPSAAPKPRPGVRDSGPVNMFAPRVQYAYFLTGDGKFHFLYVSNGDEPNPPIDFLPPGAHAQGLMVFERVAYVTTVNGCGGVDNGLWALDLETKQVNHWKTSDVVGTNGYALAPDGTIFVSGRDELVALELKTLTQKASFKAPGLRFTSSPAIFEAQGKDLVAVTTNDGALHVFDTTDLSKPMASATGIAKDYAVGSVATWQDMSGGRWILAPTGNAVSAWKLVDGKLQAAWTSRDLVSPAPPIVVNGVVFALSSGEFRTTDANMTAAQRAAKSSKAILYALDAATGKEVWNSGSTLPTFVTTGRLAAGGGRVYVGTHDGTQYAFGFPIEH